MALYERHNKSHLPEYTVWSGMKDRCHNPNSCNWSRYGARGIKVCDRWFDSFNNFYTDMGPRPSDNHSIERIDNDGNYEPNNCIWVTPDVQAYNRCDNIKVTIPSTRDEVTVKEATKILSLNKNTIHSRLSRGKDLEDPYENPITTVMFNGHPHTLKQLSDLSNIPVRVLWERLRAGWSVDKTMQTPIPEQQKYLYRGEYLTVQEISELTSVADHNIRHHLRKGLNADQIIDYITNGVMIGLDSGIKSKNLHEYKGVKYTVGGLSKISGLPSSVISDRIFSGMSIEQAVTQPLKETQTVLYQGKMISIPDLIKETGIPRNTIRRYLAKGFTVEEIVKHRNK